MPNAIEISSSSPHTFTVTADGSSHQVTVPEGFDSEFGAPDEESLVRASIEFLLAREPADDILAAFSLEQIPQHFPEYATQMSRRFGRSDELPEN